MCWFLAWMRQTLWMYRHFKSGLHFISILQCLFAWLKISVENLSGNVFVCNKYAYNAKCTLGLSSFLLLRGRGKRSSIWSLRMVDEISWNSLFFGKSRIDDLSFLHFKSKAEEVLVWERPNLSSCHDNFWVYFQISSTWIGSNRKIIRTILAKIPFYKNNY